MKLSSPAFEPGHEIPREYTGDGHNSSPPLVWSDPPAGTRSLAIVCEDPDTPKGAFTHWVVFNLPVEARELDAGIAQESALPGGAAQGANGLGRVGYDGPAPGCTRSTRRWTCRPVRRCGTCGPAWKDTCWRKAS